MNFKILSGTLAALVTLSLTGCWAAIAGAGAEAGYVAAQDDRSAGETLTDQRITAEVKTRLLADSEVGGLDINVDTHKSTVTLRGLVDSAREADRAVQIARAVNGVNGVNSRLVVD